MDVGGGALSVLMNDKWTLNSGQGVGGGSEDLKIS